MIDSQMKEEGSPMVTEEEVTEKYNINDFLCNLFHYTIKLLEENK